MKMTYTFSKREKTLMVILVIILILALWYWFVYSPYRTAIDQAASDTADKQAELTVATSQYANMQSMQASIDAAYAKAGGNPVAVPAYDNKAFLISELDSILAPASGKQLSFGDLEYPSSGNIVRRPVTITYTTTDYTQAKSILTALSDSRYRCLISDVAIVMPHASGASATGVVGTNVTDSSMYTVAVKMVYFESLGED